MGSFWRRGTELSGACVGWINDDSTCELSKFLCASIRAYCTAVFQDVHLNVNEMNSTRS